MNGKTNALYVNDGRPSLMPIQSVIDDYGLDPYTFRIYARIIMKCQQRRIARESVATMAAACRMSDRRCQKALKELVAKGLILKQERPGYENTYMLPPQ